MRSIGFLGLGNMASAIIQGIVKSAVFSGVSIYGYNPTVEKTERLQTQFGLIPCSSNAEVVKNSDVVFITVKPRVVAAVAEEVCSNVAGKLIVSLVAGRTLGYLQKAFCSNFIIRAMPNINARFGASVTGFCTTRQTPLEKEQYVQSIFETIGSVYKVPESYAGIIGAIGGASSAYTDLYINALADAALKAGMPKKLAIEIAANSVRGSAVAIQESGKHPLVLADQVCSPGGSTIEGMLKLKSLGFEHAVHEAIEAVMEKEKRM